jgi:hypothetical protein
MTVEAVRRPAAERGSSLALTFAAIGILLLSAMVLQGATCFNLWMERHAEQSQHASDLAERSLSLAMALMLQSQGTLGAQSTTGPTLRVSDSDGSGQVTFEHALPPYSTNNLSFDSTAAGWKRTVPPQAAQLLGVGCCGSVINRQEVLLRLDKFPYAIASSGTMANQGSLLVGATDGTAALLTQLSQISRSALLPADVLSNSTREVAIGLDAQALVLGNAQASGGITAPAGTVLGDCLPFQAPVSIGVLDATMYDPQGKYPAINDLHQGFQSLSQAIEGYCRASGDLTISGDLALNNAVVYVPGNLTVEGAVTGTGALIASGSVTLQRGSDLSANNMLALLANGDVALLGSSPDTDNFQGLVYTSGNFTAQRISIAGSFVANSSAPGGSIVQLQDTHAVHMATYDVVSFTVQGAPFPVPNWISYIAPPGTAPGLTGFGMRETVKVKPDLSNVVDASGYLLPDSDLIANSTWTYDFDYGAQPLTQPAMALHAVNNWQVMYQPASEWFNWYDFSSEATLSAAPCKVEVIFHNRDAADNWLLANDPQLQATVLDAQWNNIQQLWLKNVKSQLAPYLPLKRAQGQPPPGTSQFTLDLEQFIAPADRTRMVLWRTL